MKIFLRLAWLLMITHSVGSEEREAWFAKCWALVEDARQNPSPEFIKRLGDEIVGPSGRDIERRSPETQELFRAAQATLISIPGHAEYYRDRINTIYEEVKTEAERFDRGYFYLPHEWGWSFSTLAYLPSVETVRVLGEMLDDMRSMDRLNRAPKEWTADNGPPAPPAYPAAHALTKLELSGAPMKHFIQISREEMGKMSVEEYYNTNIEPWRLWYAQVKSGKRTFRFKGSEVEYNLDGPVRVAAVTPSLRQGAAAEAAGPEESGRTSPWPLIGALLVLAAAGGWYFVRRKHPA